MKDLKNLYTELKDEIEKKFEEFKRNGKNRKKAFKELLFCLLTPQSKAEVCWNTVKKIEKNGLLFEAKEKDLIPLLKGVRFRKNKAHYIVLAQKMFVKNGKIDMSFLKFGNEFEIRDWLVKNVKGMGYKEASHFLRNIGRGENIAILDRHILKCLEEYKVIDEIPKSLSKKKYIEIESKMRDFSEKIGIPLHHLDLVFWYKKSGRIFK